MNKKELIEREKKTLRKINSELEEGFNLILQHEKTVTFFGSARFKEDSTYYQMARELGKRITRELGYAVITGGGPGIMEAGSRGASEGSKSGEVLGVCIQLPHEQRVNKYVTKIVNCEHFFTRKAIMTFSAEAWLFFPGGFGTFDELFGILTLVQTGKVPLIPIILVGKDFWNKVDELIREELFKKFRTISQGDMKLYTITDDEDEIIRLIKEVPVRKWWTDDNSEDKF